jgi:hypothetical protein
MKKISLITLFLGLTGWVNSHGLDTVGRRWEDTFLNPPEATKPWVYWYWDSNNISKEGITRDLEAMAEVGIGEAMIGNIVGRSAPIGNVTVLGGEWWGCVEHAVSEAARLGIKVGMFNCPGWSQSGGPWVRPEQTMRHLVSEEMRIKGGRFLESTFKPDKEHFQLVAVQAFPVPGEDNDQIGAKSPIVTSGKIKNANLLFDGDPATVATVPASEQQIEIQLARTVTIRSLQIIPEDQPVTMECTLEARDDNGQWKHITQLKIDRARLDVTVGPIQFGPISASFPAVTARQFRISFVNEKETKLREIELSGAARLTSYIEKQLGKLWSHPEVRADSYNWPVSAEPEMKSLVVDPARVMDISPLVDKNGIFKWNVPDGEWIILYTGMAPAGVMNSPATPEGSGLEIDKMNKELAQFHFDSYIGELLRRIPKEKRSGLRHVVADSYEKGSENWTDGFAEDFKRTYGYDPYPWLPALTGRVVGNADQSERFLWDMRRLVADRIASDYIGGLRERCEENGLRLWMENYGHWGFPGEFLNYGGAGHDLGGEFWLSVPDRGNVEVRCASSAGHTYGKNIISAEAFTSHWSFNQMPRDLKIRGDWSWCEGINHFVLHVYLHQPDERKPGISAWFGTDFNRHNTWFFAAKSYFDYIRRSCALLQSGSPVADVAYFIGEDVPKMTGDREPALPRGYDYDFINAEILMKDARVVDGRIVLPSGASYAVLALPPKETMRPETLAHMATLVKAGACILGNPPKRSPSRRNYPECDSEVEALARDLWGNSAESVGGKAYGKGRVFSGMTLEEVFEKIGVMEDCILPEGFLYTHRQEENAHLYFISNQQEIARNETIAFRITGMQPELWNPVTGETRDLQNYNTADGKTFIPLEFGPGDSWFIVFRQKGAAASIGVNFPTLTPVQTVEGKWDVDFKPVYAESFRHAFTRLTDWTQNDDPRVKYYSGSAIYRCSFINDGKEYKPLYLDLGKVEGLAGVRLNGREYPVLWRYPYRVNISDALRMGANELEVVVTNCWWNRLVGDAQPGAQPVTWSAFIGWNAKSKLLPSGLLGPVEIFSGK